MTSGPWDLGYRSPHGSERYAGQKKKQKQDAPEKDILSFPRRLAHQNSQKRNTICRPTQPSVTPTRLTPLQFLAHGTSALRAPGGRHGTAGGSKAHRRTTGAYMEGISRGGPAGANNISLPRCSVPEVTDWGHPIGPQYHVRWPSRLCHSQCPIASGGHTSSPPPLIPSRRGGPRKKR